MAIEIAQVCVGLAHLKQAYYHQVSILSTCQVISHLCACQLRLTVPGLVKCSFQTLLHSFQ